MKRYILSPYVRFMHDYISNQVMVFHSLFGNPRILNQEAVEFLKIFNKPLTIKKVQKYTDGDSAEIIKSLQEIHFLIEPTEDERQILHQRKAEQLRKVRAKQTLEHISLSVSNLCNFACDFCMFFQCDVQNRNISALEGKNLMTWETAKKY